MSMMFEPVNDSFEPLSKKEISDLESSIGGQLPNDYAEFLQKYGRCMFSEEAMIRTADGKKFEIFTLFGAKGDKGNLLEDIDLHPEYKEKDVIPIADDLFNNRYVLHIDSGKISFLDYSSGVANWTVVASSFSEFLDKIELMPEKI